MGRNGSGVREASSTSYEITFTYRGIRCRERLKIKPSPTNGKRVERHLSAILDAIEKGTFDYSVTFPDSKRRMQFIERKGEALLTSKYLDGWLTGREPHLKKSTWDDYRKIVNNTIIPKFGKENLADIKRSHIREWLAEIKASNKRMANIQSVFRAALQDAVDDEILEYSPLYGWKYERKEAPKPVDDVDPFNANEQVSIIEAMSGQIQNLFKFAFWTGLRTSELVALDWRDVDWQRRIVRISRAMTQVSDAAEEPKTKAGIRDVKLLEPAYQALVDQKQHTLLKNEEIFQNPAGGERWSGDRPIRYVWEMAIKRAKVRYRRPYQTRHTYASMMLSAGESPMWVAQQMGHSDWGMIRRVYGKFIQDAIPEAGNKAVAIFGRENAGIKAGIHTPNSPKKQA